MSDFATKSFPTRDPIASTTVMVYAHDFGLWNIPALHDMDRETLERLLDGEYEPYFAALPPELRTKLMRSTPEEQGRFLTAWIHAGYDYECCAWNVWCQAVDKDNENKKHLTLEDVPVDEDALARAYVLVDEVEAIAAAVVAELKP